MPRRSSFETALFGLDLPFRRKKRRRAEELRDVITEVMEELDLSDHRGKERDYGVTFDRMTNQHFDYWLFDEMLVQISAGSGGNGIRKPLNQLRVITWRKGAKDLVRVIRKVCGFYPTIEFQRLMVFALEKEKAGYRLHPGIYRD